MSMTVPLIDSPVDVHTYRAVLKVWVDGNQLPYVLEASITRGLDQELGTAQVVCPPGTVPASVKKYSSIEILMIDQPVTFLPPRFFGYIVDWTNDLWTGDVTLVCEDKLTLAKNFYPDVEINQVNMTDIGAVQATLLKVGYSVADLEIGGTGKKLGSIDEANLFWETNQSALARIKQIDEIGLGWRTYALISGRITRRYVPLAPSSDYIQLFEEGDNIIDGSMSATKIDPIDQIEIQGGSSEVIAQMLTLTPFIGNAYWDRFELLRTIATNLDYLSAEEQAAYVLAKLGRWLRKASFTSQDSGFYQCVESVYVRSARWELDQVMWVQTVTATINRNGRFFQTFGTVSELQANNRGVNSPLVTVDGGTIGVPQVPTITTPRLPSTNDIIADFGIAPIIAQKVIVADALVTRYDIYCVDTSTVMLGTITSRAWSVTGGGNPMVSTGSGPTFKTVVDTLAGIFISETITSSTGHTKTVTRGLQNAEIPVRYRRLYVAANLEVQAGSQNWHELAPSSGNVLGVGNGPIAMTDSGLVLSSDDEFLTAAETTPFAGDTPTAVAMEVDVSTENCGAGSATGGFAISSNGGTSFTVRTSPSAKPILKMFTSRFNLGQWHAIDEDAYYLSIDGGNGWQVVYQAEPGETINDLSLSHTRNMLATSMGVRVAQTGGALLTGTSGNIIAITPDVKVDRFYCYNDAGVTYYQTADGATSFTAGMSLPDTAQAMPRGMDRDGTIPGLLYIANGTNGLWKHPFGFEAIENAAYLQMRKSGIDNAGPGPYYQVAQGLLAPVEADEPTPPAPTTGAVVFGNTNIGFYVRTAAGSWSHTFALDAEEDVAAIAADRVNAGIVYAAVRVGSTAPTFIKSLDGGATWAATASVPWDTTFDTSGLFYTYLGIQVGLDGAVYVSVPGSQAAFRGIWKSTNQGDSWTRIITYPAGVTVRSTPQFSVTANRIWYSRFVSGAALTADCFYANLDGTGQTALPSITNGSTFPTHHMKALSDTQVMVTWPETAASGDLRVWSIGDPSPTTITGPWFSSGDYMIDCQPITATTWLAWIYHFDMDTEERLFLTTDSGASWNQVHQFSDPDNSNPQGDGAADATRLVISVSPDDSNFVVMPSGYYAPSSPDQGRIIISEDAGATWTEELFPLAAAPNDFVDPRDLVMVKT